MKNYCEDTTCFFHDPRNNRCISIAHATCTSRKDSTINEHPMFKDDPSLTAALLKQISADFQEHSPILQLWNTRPTADKLLSRMRDSYTFPKTSWDLAIKSKTNEETKVETYPHKYFVQFFRNFFQIPTGEMKEYTDNKGKVHKYAELIVSRNVTFCIINPIGSTDYFDGLSILNPKDTANDLVGAKEALQKAVSYLWDETEPDMLYENFAKAFFDAFLKKNFTKENVMSSGNGFVLKVRLPFENKKRR